jgi:putative ABC transport system permease protein
MQALYDARTKEQIESIKKENGITAKITLSLEQISDIHLGSFGQDNGLESGSSITYSYILGCIGIFILIVACINFINLAIAQSLKRSKEMGIRKVVGGTRKQLIRQFMTESLFVSSISFFIAILLAFSLLPLFNAMANKHMSFSYLADYKLYIVYFLLLLLTAFIAGFYPSLVLSSFKPVKVLYNRQKLMGKNYFTKGLVVLQFTLAIFFVVSAIAIYTQMNFIYNKDLGYDTKNLLRVDMPFGETSELFKTFRNELAGDPAVTGMAGRNRGGTITNARTSGKDIEVDYSKITETFFPVLKIPFKEGRNFSPDFPSDVTHSAVVNEAFVREAGWKDPVGRTVSLEGGNKTLTVIGVIKDYHFRSLKQKITAQLFSMDSSMNYGQAWVKINPADVSKTVSSIQQTFKKISPLFPFSYQFMTDNSAKNYETEAKWRQIITVAAILFIFISCIGLLGLVILSIEQRTKEIGIRKVLGAAVSGIVVLISKDFILLITIAFLIGVPVAYYAINQWLQNFAYRIDINWWMFALAGTSIVLIVLITLSFQAIRAAIANPVKSLRSE